MSQESNFRIELLAREVATQHQLQLEALQAVDNRIRSLIDLCVIIVNKLEKLENGKEQ